MAGGDDGVLQHRLMTPQQHVKLLTQLKAQLTQLMAHGRQVAAGAIRHMTALLQAMVQSVLQLVQAL